VEVDCGIYFEHDILLQGKSNVIVRSASALAECVTVDAELMSRAFIVLESDNVTIKGFTVINGRNEGPYGLGHGGGCLISADTSVSLEDCIFMANTGHYGGAIEIQGGSVVSLNRCRITNNVATQEGGGINCWMESSLSLNDCLVDHNIAFCAGGMMCHTQPSLEVDNCTFCNNMAKWGAEYAGGMWVAGDNASIRNSIIAFSQSGEAMVSNCSDLTIECCDFYGNDAGDWVGVIADQLGVNGNFRADPGFCDAEGGDFRLCSDSWCLPVNLPSWAEAHCPGALIGAFGEGCGPCDPVSNEVATWGAVKILYR
jgi:hypothetical protein